MNKLISGSLDSEKSCGVRRILFITIIFYAFVFFTDGMVRIAKDQCAIIIVFTVNVSSLRMVRHGANVRLRFKGLVANRAYVMVTV